MTMTEAEWLACADPVQMVGYLEGSASRRALLLLSCACCRRVWHLLETATLRQAVDTCERFADGEIDEQEFRAAAFATHPLMNYREEIMSGQWREDVMLAAYAINTAMVAVRGNSYSKAIEFYALAARSSSQEQRATLIDLIRDVFGNPFSPSPSLPGPVLTWNDGTVRRIAEGIYEERAFDRLPILADALLDAGCDDEELLAHCRSEGPHVRGCWAVDLVLGKT
jgi:hypothetical protein